MIRPSPLISTTEARGFLYAREQLKTRKAHRALTGSRPDFPRSRRKPHESCEELARVPGSKNQGNRKRQRSGNRPLVDWKFHSVSLKRRNDVRALRPRACNAPTQFRHGAARQNAAPHGRLCKLDKQAVLKTVVSGDRLAGSNPVPSAGLNEVKPVWSSLVRRNPRWCNWQHD